MASHDGRILVTHDHSTMPRHFRAFVQSQRSPRIAVRQPKMVRVDKATLGAQTLCCRFLNLNRHREAVESGQRSIRRRGNPRHQVQAGDTSGVRARGPGKAIR